MMLTYFALLGEGEERLMKAKVTEAKIDAWYLFSEVFQIDQVHYLMDKYEVVTDESLIEKYRDLICQRCGGVPVQYLIGTTEFMGLPFKVSPSVLIPRQDTEILVETALEVLDPEMRVLDMCTGSGCIILSLAKLAGLKSAVGADISPEALKVAAVNRFDLDLDQVELVESDLFEHIDGRFDMIVSNPPYIPTDVVETLMPEVKDHEPRLALDGSADGLKFYRQLATQAGDHLKEGGYLIMEIGYDQAEPVTELLSAEGYRDIKVIKDLAGLDRVVFAIHKMQIGVSHV